MLLIADIGPQAACDPKCEKFGQGKCQSDGSCLCWWGWTGPNATYITTGNLTNRIKVAVFDSFSFRLNQITSLCTS